MNPAAIALFAYARPDHLARTIRSLANNPLAGCSDLFVFSDAPGTHDKRQGVEEVRALLGRISGFRSVNVVRRYANLGLARSIIEGVSWLLEQRDRVIVLEDDMITSPHFLDYMNVALEKYESAERVACIHGYSPPVSASLPETYFLRGADCWGWATWRRGWQYFDPDGKALLNQLRAKSLLREFDCNGSYPFSRMLRDQVSGRNDSWAIRWHAATFLAGKLTLYPARSLIQNIGIDGSGTHGGVSSSYQTYLSTTPVTVNDIPIEPSRAARVAFESFYREAAPSLVSRLRNCSMRCLGRVLQQGKKS